MAPRKQPSAPPFRMAAQLQKHSVCSSKEGYVGFQLTGLGYFSDEFYHHFRASHWIEKPRDLLVWGIVLMCSTSTQAWWLQSASLLLQPSSATSVCSVATSPPSPGIWQAVPLTTLMEIPAKQAASQVPLSFWKEARLGKAKCVVDPWTWTMSQL